MAESRVWIKEAVHRQTQIVYGSHLTETSLDVICGDESSAPCFWFVSKEAGRSSEEHCSTTEEDRIKRGHMKSDIVLTNSYPCNINYTYTFSIQEEQKMPA